MWESILSTFIGVLAGGGITWIAAKHYYEKASDHLRKEADGLKSLTKFIGVKLHESEIIKLPLDSNGRPTYNQSIKPKSIS